MKLVDKDLLKRKLDITEQGLWDNQCMVLLDSSFKSTIFSLSDDHHIKILNYNKCHNYIKCQNDNTNTVKLKNY